MQSAFQIDKKDNVATALETLEPGAVKLLGEPESGEAVCTEEIPKGHKMAVRAIAPGEDVVKYGVPIGKADTAIRPGVWVHLHNMHSAYDERSGHLDVHTGVPKDIEYE